MASDGKTERLHRLELFQHADKKAMEHVGEAAEEVTVEAGHVIIRQGHANHEAYVVESGAVTVAIDGEDIAEVGVGDIIGEMGIFDPCAASATLTAKTEVSLLVLPYNRLGQILDENPAMLRDIARTLARRLRATDQRLH